MPKATLKAIVPSKTIVQKQAFVTAYVDAMNAVTKGMKADYKSTTQHWRTFVAFYIVLPQLSGGNYQTSVGTDSVIYGYVDAGTKAHIIAAKNGGYLSFRTGYIARTIPRVLHSGQSKYTGGWARKRVVRHPGTQARRFSVIIQIKWQDEFEKRLRMATEKAAAQ